MTTKLQPPNEPVGSTREVLSKKQMLAHASRPLLPLDLRVLLNSDSAISYENARMICSWYKFIDQDDNVRNRLDKLRQIENHRLFGHLPSSIQKMVQERTLSATGALNVSARLERLMDQVPADEESLLRLQSQYGSKEVRRHPRTHKGQRPTPVMDRVDEIKVNGFGGVSEEERRQIMANAPGSTSVRVTRGSAVANTSKRKVGPKRKK